MLKFCVKQWDKNKDRLKEDIVRNFKEYSECNYDFLVEKVVDLVLNDDESDYGDNEFDSSEITKIDNGDYQGTLLYMIPKKTYQPSADDYLMTYVYYGSCSGCDTLQSIQSDIYLFDEEDEISPKDKEQFIKDVIQLCLHLIQHMIKPYKSLWGAEDDNFVEMNDSL